MTALFDLTRRERNPDRWPPEHYLERAEFLFALDENLVCFVDAEFVDHVVERRRALGHLERTLVVPTALEDLPAYAQVERIIEAHRTHPILNASPFKDTPLFVALVWSKLTLVERAVALDPFGDSHYAWIDFGLHQVPPRHLEQDRVFARPSACVRLLMMRSFTAEEVADPGYYSYFRGHVAAGYITGSGESMKRLRALFDREAAWALERGYGPTEEQLLPVICVQDPELFEFHYGDYGHILENYVCVRGSAPNLLFQMRHCRSTDDWKRASDIGSHVLDSVRTGTFESDSEHLAGLLDECFIAAYHADHPREEAARGVVELYAKLARTDPGVRDVFLRHEIRLRSNFALLREPVEFSPPRVR